MKSLIVKYVWWQVGATSTKVVDLQATDLESIANVSRRSLLIEKVITPFFVNLNGLESVYIQLFYCNMIYCTVTTKSSIEKGKRIGHVTIKFDQDRY